MKGTLCWVYKKGLFSFPDNSSKILFYILFLFFFLLFFLPTFKIINKTCLKKKMKQCNWSIKKDTTNYVFKTSLLPGVMKINDFLMIINGELIDNISSYEFSVFLHGRNRISAYVNFFEFFQRNFYFQNRLLWTEMVQYCIVHILNSRLLECASIIYIHVLWYNILIS